MPLSTNKQTVDTASAVVNEMRTVFKPGPGNRPGHAKGHIVTGSWTPTEEAKTLSRAQYFNEYTPVTVRFSNATGLPQIPDTDPNSNPRGLAIRFHLGDRKHTDIFSHSTPHFPVSTGADFLAFFKSIGNGTVGEFLGSHSAALAFVQAPKPFAKSFATEQFHALNAFKAINAEGKETFFRYRFDPDAGHQTYEASEMEGKSADFLRDELQQRLKSGPISFTLIAQIGEPGDVTDDITKQWPEDRKQIKLGTIRLDTFVEDSAELQRTIIFDPVPRLDGLEPSDDPLLDFRASVYLISGRDRREAGGYDREKLPKVNATPKTVEQAGSAITAS